MTIKLYYDFMSQPARALYIFLKKTNIPFELVRVNVGKGEHKTPEYRKNINPLGLIPVIDDNGFILRESVGILRYLCREKNVPDHWYPKDSKAQAKMDEYLEYQHLGTRLPCGFYFRLTFVEPLFQKEPHEVEVNRFKEMMKMSCDAFEKIWLKDNTKFLYGDQISIADLLAATELEQPRMSGYDPREGRPKLTAYLDRVRAETQPYYDEAHITVDRLSTSSLRPSKL